MIKTYKTKFRGYNIIVKVNGENKNINFQRGFIISSLRGSLFTTDDKELQKAIEAHRDFNIEFWTDDKEPVIEEPVKKTVVEESVEKIPAEEAPKEEKKVKRYSPKK